MWDPYYQKDKDRLEMFQWRAVFYVTMANTYRRTAEVSNMLKHLEWTSLEDRSEQARQCRFYKIHHGLVYMNSDILTPHKRLTRNMHQFTYQVPSCTNDFRKFSFFPRTICDWNALSAKVAASESLGIFRSQVTEIIKSRYSEKH